MMVQAISGACAGVYDIMMSRVVTLLFAMHESIVVSTSGLYTATRGFQKRLEQTTEWRRVRQCIWRARCARTQDTLLALSGRHYH